MALPVSNFGIGLEKVKLGPGIDAIDALLVSLRIAEALLKSYGQASGKKVTWLGEEELGLCSSNQDQIPEYELSLFEMNDDRFEKMFGDFFLNFSRKSTDTPSEASEDSESE